MIYINEMGIKSSSSPNVYVNKIALSYGSSRSPKISNAVNKSETPVKTKTKSGDTAYKIRGIEASYIDSTEVQADVQVYIQDVSSLKGNDTSIFYNDRIRERVNLVVFQSTNKQLTDAIIKNNIFDNSALSILSEYNKYIDYQMVETSLSADNNDISSLYTMHNQSSSNVIQALVKNFKFYIPHEPAHLTYFVFTKLTNINKMRSETRVVHSPVVVERVVENSSLIKKSFLFKDASGKIWPGPVHLHPDLGWMKGAFHIDSSHGSLKKETINNFKVGDARVLRKVEELDINIISPKMPPNVNYFSLFTSKRADGTVGSVIRFDILKFLIANSNFGGLINTASSMMKQQIIDRSEILSLEFIRNKAKTHKGENKIGGASDIVTPTKRESSEIIIESADQSGRLERKLKYVLKSNGDVKFVVKTPTEDAPENYTLFGSIEEISLQNEKTSRSFSIADVGMGSITTGKYQYEIKITLQDGAFKCLSDSATELRESVYGMKNYLSLASTAGNFNKDSGRFSTPFVSSVMDEDNKFVDVWMGSIINYIKALDLITDLQNKTKADLNRELYFMVSPITGTLDGIEYFIELLEKLENKLSGLIFKKKVAHLEDKSSEHQTRGNQYLTVRRAFSQVVESNFAKDTGFDYIGINKQNTGISKLTSKEFSDRLSVELDRISKNLYNASELVASFSFLNQEEVNALLTRNNDLAYIAPAYVDIFGYKTNLLQSNINLDYVTVTAVLQNLLRNPTSRTMALLQKSNIFKLLAQQGTGVSEQRISDLNDIYMQNAITNGLRFESANSQLNKEQLRSLISSAQYFGSDSKFTTTGEEVQDLTVRLPDSLPNDAISLLDRILEVDITTTSRSPLSATPLVDISFNLSKDNNYLIKTMRQGASLSGVQNSSIKLSAGIKALPTQIKLLTLNRNRFYGDAVGSLGSDDDAQTDGFVYNFGMIRAVEYWNGSGWSPLNNRIVSSLSSYLLCRIRKINNPAVKIGYFELLDELPVYDEHFLLFNAAKPPNSKKFLSNSFKTNTLRADKMSYNKSSFTQGPERSYFSQLNKFESQRKELYNQAEYTVTEPPLAPTGIRGKEPGIPKIMASPGSTMGAASTRVRNGQGPARDSGVATGGGSSSGGTY